MNLHPTLRALVAVCLFANVLHAQQRPDTLKFFTEGPAVVPEMGAYLGSSVAMDGNLVIAGAPRDSLNHDGRNGTAKIFDAATGTLLHVLMDPTPSPGNRFGESVAISGTRVVVGAPLDDVDSTDAGVAYVYDLSSARPTIPVAVLRDPNPATYARFGRSVGIAGSTVAVGAPNLGIGANASAVYVFNLSSATPATPIATLNSPSPSLEDRFGESIAISGSRLVVSASGNDIGAQNSGAAYVYSLDGGTPTVPVLTLQHPNPGADAMFGISVAISSASVIVSAYGAGGSETTRGIAYLYDLDSGIPGAPTLTLNSPSSTMSDRFATSVAISGQRLVVGAERNFGGAANFGRAYVYDLNSGSPSNPVITINSPDQNTGYGESVAISGARVAIGAAGSNAVATGAGIVFVYDVQNPPTATLTAKLGFIDPAVTTFFGNSLAISGNLVIAGSKGDDIGAIDAGGAQVFDLNSAQPTVPVLSLYNPSPSPGTYFGLTVAASGTRFVVGTGADENGATGPINVYVYDIASPTPTVPVLTLQDPNPALDGFGRTVAISGTFVIVGAPGSFLPGDTGGKVYIYDLSSQTPTVPTATLNDPEPAAQDQFGGSLAVDGTRLIVGAPGDDAGATDAGRVYVFDLTEANPSASMVTLNNPTPADQFFGSSVSVSGNRVAASSNAGKALVFDLSSETPGVPSVTLSNPNPAASGFGPVAISGSQVIIGASNYSVGGRTVGRAYVYDVVSSTPTARVATLDSPHPTTNSGFGSSLAIQGAIAVVGVPYNLPLPMRGAIYVFGSDETITRPPILTNPTSFTLNANPVTIDYTLPEAAFPGSVKLTFAGATTTTLALANSMQTSGTHTLALNTVNPTLNPEVASGSPIPDGQYSVILSYQDQFGSSAASDSVIHVTLDATPPVISNVPEDMVAAATSSMGAVVNYSMPVATDSSGINSLQASMPSGATFPIGTTIVTFTAKDLVNNTSTASFTVTVRLEAPLSGALVVQGGEAPGAGTPNGPPAGATFASFGVPAIDAGGHVAFSAKWTSGEGSGSGIFRDDTFIAKVGGAVPGLSGATFKTFTDPVIDGGRVAFLGTEAGVPKAQSSVVVSDVGGTLEVVAQAGTNAPGTGDAKFKMFKSVSVTGGSVGVLAQLTPGSGATRTTAASDIGLWVKTGANPLVLALREGQDIAAGKKIKTLVSFAGGNGSPGQGRGWLIDTGDSAQILAHASLTDKSQAIIAVALDDLAHPVILSQTGTGSSFASFSLPAVNTADHSTFLGSLTLGGDVIKANARGIFADLEADGTYSPIVRVGDTAKLSGVTFNLLKDPVLAADGGVAFPATLNGKAIKGLAAQTLWWQPPGGEPALVAQGGAGTVPVADIPGAQWKSFPSLAIAANRGPIFTGTLVPGKGGVTKATSSGLWATDFQGNLRLLIQSGVTQIDGKTVKSFTLLNATVGSQGTTRSFNDNAFVVWRATFGDKSQAIIKTEVP